MSSSAIAVRTVSVLWVTPMSSRFLTGLASAGRSHQIPHDSIEHGVADYSPAFLPHVDNVADVENEAVDAFHLIAPPRRIVDAHLVA